MPAYVLAILVLAGTALGGQPPPDSAVALTPQQAQFLDSLARAFRVTECRGSTLRECAVDTTGCSLCRRLYVFVEWVAAHEADHAKVAAALKERYEGLTLNVPGARMAMSPFATAGKPGAPVVITVYMSGSCPLCKRLCTQLYDAVTIGPLAGVAILSVKPFTAGPADLALAGAEQCGAFWRYLRALAAVETRPDQKLLQHLADSRGLPAKRFGRALRSDSLVAALDGWGREGRALGVTVTPTFFINGRRYHGYKDSRWVVDATQYEQERLVAGRRGAATK
jgi:protein-disulfide isomerase